MHNSSIDAFGKNLCHNKVLKDRLPRPIYELWKEALAHEKPLDPAVADAIAHVMKTWAIENGATHYSHWFQPMTGNTAEKHDAFLESNDNGVPITRFSGKSLIKGEADGSSFPSGGLRATFEARGYTYWDITSPAFIRGHVLCIPSVFVSFNGEALDKKTPLLRSMRALSKEATRVLHLLGDKEVKGVTPNLGQEQEYFLVDANLFKQRLDLKLTGRTLIGQAPAKGQDSEDHYFGSISENVNAFMEDVNKACWELGIYSKVEHNEVAFNQFEIVPMYSPTHIAIDQNQLIMDILKKTAKKHGLECLLHEKPFAGINGSGKHNNWSLQTDTGLNLFDPSDEPGSNLRFLVFVVAVMATVDKYPTLLRMSASGAGNDHRLGANEAPPAIISIYLGSTLEDLLRSLATGVASITKTREVHSPLSNLKEMPKEFSDRNRTSPFAFTGSKFEFRMVGSSRSAATTNTILNAALADELALIANEIESSKKDLKESVLDVLISRFNKHERILFSGDGYSQAWVEEAARRGLPNIKSFNESIDSYLDPATLAMFARQGVYNDKEVHARVEILHDQFFKAVLFEARSLSEMLLKYILPATLKDIHQTSLVKSRFADEKVSELTTLVDDAYDLVKTLMLLVDEAHTMDDIRAKGKLFNDIVRPHMIKCREVADRIESLMDHNLYPIPTYTDLLFSF
ncbi:MAG: glutamine synthetase III [Erysipelothrix sp.]|jgi:glutamine synthetase|nr:glutamine synthetase III [Erysipelothrix sp.]